jgi:hypothetical protein
MSFKFSTADGRMFARAQRILGGPAEELLRSRLADGVLGDGISDPVPAGRKWGPVDAPYLRRIGLDELGILPDILETDSLPREPAPSARVLRSLRATLLGPGNPSMDIQIRAGLHRLGRAAADLDASALQDITGDLPAAWVRCVKTAWFRLSRLKESRASAATLRELLSTGGRR